MSKEVKKQTIEQRLDKIEQKLDRILSLLKCTKDGTMEESEATNKIALISRMLRDNVSKTCTSSSWAHKWLSQNSSLEHRLSKIWISIDSDYQQPKKCDLDDSFAQIMYLWLESQSADSTSTQHEIDNSKKERL